MASHTTWGPGSNTTVTWQPVGLPPSTHHELATALL